jgi:hypothetical protein
MDQPNTEEIENALDAADPRALATILPPELSERVRTLPRELLIQDEVTLTTLIGPTDQQKRIKIQFWDEYEDAMKQRRNIELAHIIFGVCTREYLLEFIRVARNVAWLVSPRPRYSVRVAELVDKGLDQIEEIFKLQATGKNTIAVRSLQLSALRMLDMRKHGGYTQRQEVKSLALTKNLNDSPSTGAPTGEGSIEQLEAQVREMEARIAKGKNQNGALLDAPRLDVIDVTPRMEDGSKELIASETK